MPLPDYDFFCPVKICSGNKALENLPFELQLLDARKPLLLTNEVIAGDGRVKNIINAFKDSNLSMGLFDDVPSEADLKTVFYIAEMYREKKCDAIIAVGGGSVVDIAKVVNLAVSEATDNLEQFTKEGSIKKPLRPFAAVLTSSGTGFETSPFAAIEGTSFSSQYLMPNLVIIDPRMLRSEKTQTTLAAALTTLAHAVEAYTCHAKNPLTDIYAYPAIQLIHENLVDVIKNPGNKKGQVALINAATMASCIFSPSPGGMIHKLGQAVSNTCSLPLGMCLGILLPDVLEYHTRKNGYDPTGLLLPLADPEGYAATSEDQKSQQVIEILRKFLKDIYAAAEGKMPLTLKAAKISKEKLEDLAQAVSVDIPEEVDRDDCLMILEHAFTSLL